MANAKYREERGHLPFALRFWCCRSLERRLAVGSHDYGKDPFAELGAVLRDALIYAAGTGLEYIKR